MSMPTSPDLDEFQRRLPGFSEASVWIELADGQQWAFPKPWVEIRGVFSGGKPSVGAARTTHGPEFDEIVACLGQVETNEELIVATLMIGAFLLRKNYDLADEELEELFVFRFADESLEAGSLAMVQAIADVALGRGEASF